MFFMNSSYLLAIPQNVVRGNASFTSMNVNDDVYSDSGTYNLLYKVYRIDNASQVNHITFRIKIATDPKRRCSYAFFSHRESPENLYILPFPGWTQSNRTGFERELLELTTEPNSEILKSNIELPARYIYGNMIVLLGGKFNVDSSDPTITIKVKDVNAGVSDYLYFCIISYHEPTAGPWDPGSDIVYTNFEVSTRENFDGGGGSGDGGSEVVPPPSATASGTKIVSNLGSIMRSSTILNLETNEKIVIRVKR